MLLEAYAIFNLLFDERGNGVESRVEAFVQIQQ
jgi:hypothetical protein